MACGFILHFPPAFENASSRYARHTLMRVVTSFGFSPSFSSCSWCSLQLQSEHSRGSFSFTFPPQGAQNSPLSPVIIRHPTKGIGIRIKQKVRAKCKQGGGRGSVAHANPGREISSVCKYLSDCDKWVEEHLIIYTNSRGAKGADFSPIFPFALARATHPSCLLSGNCQILFMKQLTRKYSRNINETWAQFSYMLWNIDNAGLSCELEINPLQQVHREDYLRCSTSGRRWLPIW